MGNGMSFNVIQSVLGPCIDAIIEHKTVRVVSLLGLLHHLQDEDAQNVLRLSHDIISQDGFIITLDGCQELHAPKLERFFYWIDRGQHIRSSARLGVRVRVRVFLKVNNTCYNRFFLNV